MQATFKHLCLLATVVSAVAATVSWYSAPPIPEQIFGSGAQHAYLVGEAEHFTPPRGVPQLRITKAHGGAVYLSCIALPEVCGSVASRAGAVTLEATVASIASNVVWPVAVHQPAFAVLTPLQSQARYVEYRDYQGSFWHFWAGLALVMLGFAAWFRNRPMFPG